MSFLSRINRDHLLLIAVLFVLGGLTVFISWRQQQIAEAQRVRTALSSHSPNPDGTLALYQWLRESGYRTERIEYRAFTIPNDARLLFVHSPTTSLEPIEVNEILDWVEQGNILFASSGTWFGTNELFRELDASLDFVERVQELAAQQPIANEPIGSVTTEAHNVISFDRNDFAQYAGTNELPVLAQLKYGEGTIWLSSAPAILTNENLKNPENAKFAAALAAQVPTDSLIVFDEYHLGLQPEPGASLGTVMYDSPWGWGVILGIIVLFGYLLLSGQRLGRVLPAPRQLSRRSPSEYVTSMANLFRRANKRGMVLNHYRHSLKRRLGRPYHLSPDIEDSRYVEMLSRLRPDLDRAELTRLLNSLRRTDTGEADLVKTIEQSVTFGGRTTQG